MSSPVLTPSSGNTVNRKWVPEVNVGTIASPTWMPIEYVNQFKPAVDAPSLQDSTVFADAGFSGQVKTGAAWSATSTVMRDVIAASSPPVYGVAQEFLRLKAIGQFGAANRVQIRFYEYDPSDPTGVIMPRIEAYMGFAAVGWEEQGGAQDAVSTVVVTLTGQGKLSIIAHPYALGAAIPLVLSISPLPMLAAGGTVVRILGQGFTGITTLTIAGVAVTAPNRSLVNDGELVAVAPAHAAGSGLPVVVTNATGPSTSGATLASFV